MNIVGFPAPSKEPEIQKTLKDWPFGNEQLGKPFGDINGMAYSPDFGHDATNPEHYRQLPEVEMTQVARHFSFCLGNVIKYVWRADHKGKPIEDLKKALWYLQEEIKWREKKTSSNADGYNGC